MLSTQGVLQASVRRPEHMHASTSVRQPCIFWLFVIIIFLRPCARLIANVTCDRNKYTHTHTNTHTHTHKQMSGQNQREACRAGPGPTGCLPTILGARYVPSLTPDAGATFDIVAPGGLTVGGSPVRASGAFATAALAEDVELTVADAGVVHVVDTSRGDVHVTLPASTNLVGLRFEFVMKENGGHAFFSLRDNAEFIARATFGQFPTRSAPVSLLGDLTLQRTCTVLHTPNTFELFDHLNHVFIESSQPIRNQHTVIQQIIEELQQAGEIGDAFNLYSDPEATVAVPLHDLSSTLGFRASLATRGDTIRFFAASPDLVIAECHCKVGGSMDDGT